MKKMRVLMLATLMGAAVSGQAFADDTSGQSGTMAFNATLQEGTCQLSGQNINHNFGTLSKAQAPIRSGVFASYKVFNDSISVTNCPAGVGEVVMTPSYTIWGSYHNVVDNTSSSSTKSNAKMLIGSEAGLGDVIYSNGQAKSFPVVDGNVNIPIVTQVTKPYETDITSGDADFSVQLAFAYQ